MTNTLPSKNGSTSPKRAGQDSAVGLQKHKRTAIDIGLALITPIVGQEFLDRYNLRDPLNRSLKYGVKQVFSAAGASTRQFKRIQGLGKAPTRLKASGADYFDLTPDDDQKMIVETVEEFAEEILRPAARDADDAASYPPDLIAKAAELGITAINIPEDFDGIAAHRSTVTNALVAEALAYGDMGLALPILAPGGVASALTHWGSADQQATYLKEFAGENVPAGVRGDRRTAAAVRPDRAEDDGGAHAQRLPALRREVVGARRRGRRIVHRRRAIVRQARAVHRRVVGRRACPSRPIPSMGIRAAALGRVELDNVSVPLSARLGEDGATDADYSEAIALARLGWAALAVGTSHAVLDHVVPYIKERQAFGEPIAHRQAVAFMTANIAIELDGLRLITWRGASRAEQGLPFAREAALAKRLGTDKGMQIGLDGVQLLGGHGYTKEHPVERWYRDLRAIGVAEGVVVI